MVSTMIAGTAAPNAAPATGRPISRASHSRACSGQLRPRRRRRIDWMSPSTNGTAISTP